MGKEREEFSRNMYKGPMNKAKAGKDLRVGGGDGCGDGSGGEGEIEITVLNIKKN